MGWRRRTTLSPYPGRGPFSHLPPWERPGWVWGGRGYGRGARMCARFPWLQRGWWADPAYLYQPSALASQDEIAALEESKNALGQEKDSIEQEINAIEKQVKELKAKLDSENNQPTGGQ